MLPAFEVIPDVLRLDQITYETVETFTPFVVTVFVILFTSFMIYPLFRFRSKNKGFQKSLVLSLGGVILLSSFALTMVNRTTSNFENNLINSEITANQKLVYYLYDKYRINLTEDAINIDDASDYTLKPIQYFKPSSSVIKMRLTDNPVASKYTEGKEIEILLELSKDGRDVTAYYVDHKVNSFQKLQDSKSKKDLELPEGFIVDFMRKMKSLEKPSEVTESPGPIVS